MYVYKPKDSQSQEIEHIKTLARNFHSSLTNSAGAIHYNPFIHPIQCRFKRGRPYDLL